MVMLLFSTAKGRVFKLCDGERQGASVKCFCEEGLEKSRAERGKSIIVLIDLVGNNISQ